MKKTTLLFLLISSVAFCQSRTTICEKYEVHGKTADIEARHIFKEDYYQFKIIGDDGSVFSFYKTEAKTERKYNSEHFQAVSENGEKLLISYFFKEKTLWVTSEKPLPRQTFVYKNCNYSRQ